MIGGATKGDPERTAAALIAVRPTNPSPKSDASVQIGARPSVAAGQIAGPANANVLVNVPGPGEVACTLPVRMPRYVITGAPGTGKTALVESLSDIAATIGEPARELIAEHRSRTGERSLDGSPELFVELLVARSVEKFVAGGDAAVAIYDRGIPDCVAYAAGFGVDAGAAVAAAERHRYANPVFMAPPWEAIYTVDDMRRATFGQVGQFHDELVAAYETLGYELVVLPKASVAERVAFVIGYLEAQR